MPTGNLRNPLLTALTLATAFAFCAKGQTTASGTVSVRLVNQSGISIVFDTNASGAALTNGGTAASTLNFGTVSAFGSLPAGVTRSAVLSNMFTVGTFFNIQVQEGGITSTSYRLTAQLATASPTGFGYSVDGVTLSTTSSAIQSSATYNADVQHTLNLTVSTAAPGAGGPALNTPLTTTLNFTATAN
jgi:hypothetical protein